MTDVTLMQGDCLERMKDIPDGSIDMVLADPPYGTTACKWDTVIDLPSMWAHLKRIVKPNGAIVMTASQPFTSALVMSNPDAFKYCWVWNKKKGGSPLLSKKQPIRVSEDVVVFGEGEIVYNPIMEKRDKPVRRGSNTGKKSDTTRNAFTEDRVYTHKYPKNILEISNANQRGKSHPTQKPVALMEYLIKTYTNEGYTVLDFTMGSGSTGVACMKTGRKFIGIELDADYYAIAKQRIDTARTLL